MIIDMIRSNPAVPVMNTEQWSDNSDYGYNVHNNPSGKAHENTK